MIYMKLLLFVILLGNILPLLVGILGYQASFGPFSTFYVSYTILFWSIASIFFLILNRKAMRSIPCMLRDDLTQIGRQRFFLTVTFLLIVANIQWLTSARDMGIDNRGLVFKLFFLFEDLYFVTFILLIYRTLARPSWPKVLSVMLLTYPLVAIFGRFVIIVSAALVFLSIRAAHQTLSRNMAFGIIVLIVSVFFGLTYVENSRAVKDGSEAISVRFLDRVGEFATLSVVDYIFSDSRRYGFSDFGKIAYIWAPSVIFPEKPIIADGSVFLRNEFSLGAGENQTRFPILLQVDSFRRFGWAGLWVALLPAVAFRFMFVVSDLFSRCFRVPFLSFVLIKYSLYFYPKSILGLIEISAYTFVRTALVFLLLTVLYRILTSVNRRAPQP